MDYLENLKVNNPNNNMYPTTALEPGSTNKTEVKKLQDFLVSQGFMTPTQVSTGPGIYGPQTTAAVKAWQQANGVDNSTGPGYWGPRSIAVASGSSSPSSSGTGSSVGSYQGVPITPGTDAQIQAQMAAIDAGTPGTQNNGTSSSSVQNYGSPENASAESSALMEVNQAHELGTFEKLIDGAYLDKLMADPDTLALWVHAIAYGGYTGEDILRDMKRKEMEKNGDITAKNLMIIDPTKTKAEYYATPEGKQALSTVNSIMPNIKSGAFANSDFLQYGLNMPDEIFKTLVPLLNKDSQEFKDAVSKIKETYFNLADAQMQAGTEQEKAVADYQYKEFKKQLEEKYGIALNDDATKAWTQIETLGDTFNTRGIEGSGLQNEAVDQTLQMTRKEDQRLRQAKLTDEEAKKAAYYTSSASAAEINALTPEEKQKYGLTPSAEVLDKYSIATLTAKYPNKPADEIQAIHDSMIDENGNYRSSLYSKKYTSLAETSIANTTAAESQVLQEAQNKELAVSANFDKTHPFSSTTTQDSQVLNEQAADSQTPVTSTKTVTPPSVQQLVDAYKANGPLTAQQQTGYAPLPTSTSSSSAYVAPKTSSVVTQTQTPAPATNTTGSTMPTAQQLLDAYKKSGPLTAQQMTGYKSL